MRYEPDDWDEFDDDMFDDDMYGDDLDGWDCDYCGGMSTDSLNTCSICHAVICAGCAISGDDVYPTLCPGCEGAITGRAPADEEEL